MLERFRKAKQAEIGRLETLAAQGKLPAPSARPRPSFTGALRARSPLAVIAEYKRASPSRGDINLALSPEAAAKAYAQAGAGAISVLTEEEYFKGDLAFLSRMTGPGLPLLRKDFIFHPLQVDQTAASPASALLLIVRMLEPSALPDLIGLSAAHGLEAVVEVFDRRDLDLAQSSGASIIQVNNRDLDTLQVNMDRSRELIGRKQDGEFWITASGIDNSGLLASLLSGGYDAALVGSFLMQGNNPGQELAGLLKPGKNDG